MSIEDFEGKDDGPAFVYVEYIPGALGQGFDPLSSGCQLFKAGTVLVPCGEVPTAFKVVGVYDTFREAYAAHEALACDLAEPQEEPTVVQAIAVLPTNEADEELIDSYLEAREADRPSDGKPGWDAIDSWSEE